MKTYEVNLMMNFNKNFIVHACDKDEALELIKDIFFNTNLITLTEEDLDSVDLEIESDSDSNDLCECSEEDCDCRYCTDEEYLYDELY